MELLVLILPISLLILSFSLKLLIIKGLDKVNALKALCEFPVDMVFLSISFIMAYIILVNEKIKTIEGLGFFIVGIIVSIGVVLIWRVTSDMVINITWKFYALLILNIIIATISISIAIHKVYTAVSIETEEKTETSQDASTD